MSNMFLLDELYENNDDYPKDKSNICKFLFYKFNRDGIDADVCYKIIKDYCRQFDFLKEAKIESQPSCYKKFQIRCKMGVFRGETLVNCMDVLKQIVNASTDKNERFYNGDIEKNRDLILNNKFIKENEDMINKFVYFCYTPGNFFPIPFCKGKSLNIAKGRLKQSGYNNILLNDSADVFFQALYSYFTNHQTDVSLVKYIDCCDEYNEWKMRYLCEDSANKVVDKFIKDYHFEAFFDGIIPKVFWKKQNDYKDGILKYMSEIVNALEERNKQL